MTGSWPLILPCGSGRVSARREGAYTVFQAECGGEGLWRISLYGGGRELYLGLLAPDGAGGLALTRRMTRSELSGFAEPEYAAEAGQSGAGARQPEPLEAAPAPREAAPTEQEAASAPREDAPTERETASATREAAAGAPWYSAEDGTLSRFEDGRLLVALPCEGLRLPDWASGVLRRINGREYIVFPR